MLDYMKLQRYDTFFTIPEACEHFGWTKEELRAKCEQYGVEVFKINGQWGFPGENFRRFNNTLYFEQCRDGSDDSRIWTSTTATQSKQQKTSGRTSSMRNYIKNIKGLASIYTFDESCTLLGVTPEELDQICEEEDIPTFQDADGVRIITCYEYLTLNNRLYKRECEASRNRDLA